MRHLPLYPTLLAAVLLLGGCIAGGDPPETAPEAEATQRPDATVRDDERGVDPIGDREAPADLRQITVVASDYGFDPRRFAVDAGESIALTLINESTQNHHAIDVDHQEGQRLMHQVGPGERTTVVVQMPAEPGEYRLYCPMGDHRTRGMTGTLVVRGDQPAAP